MIYKPGDCLTVKYTMSESIPEWSIIEGDHWLVKELTLIGTTGVYTLVHMSGSRHFYVMTSEIDQFFKPME
jgi:hypothetical protein